MAPRSYRKVLPGIVADAWRLRHFETLFAILKSRPPLQRRNNDDTENNDLERQPMTPTHQHGAGCGCGIDVHTHFVPERLPPLPAGSREPTWPSMAPGDTCNHRHVMVAGKNYRTVTSQCWSAPQRLEDMAGMQVARQALSPMPELLSYWMEGKDAAVLHRDINEQMTRLAEAHPGKFDVLVAVPLQDVELAIAELEYAATVLKATGAEIGSNINGRYIGSPEFEPFFAAAERLGMAIFVHAMRPAGLERLIGPPAFEQVLGFPNEIGHSAASAITSNLLLRHPKLRIAFSHGGGSLAILLPRLQHGWHNFPPLQKLIEKSPFEQARLLYYDTLVYDPPTLRFLLERFGADALMIGTDYPFTIMETDPLGQLAALQLDADTLGKLRYANAERFLKRPD